MTNGEKFKEVFGFGADGSRVIAVNKTWWDCDFQNSKPITNADRIRSMTDEELAEYLYSRGNDSEYCYGICAFQDECKEWKSHEFCIEHIVEWLKQEVNK